MARTIVGFIAGAIFGFGLSLSEMINPARVIGFLDIAGRWDPTLIFVMAGALAISLPAFQGILRRRRPLLDEKFFLPSKQEIDGRLILGAVLFGIGWGLAGFCPGPAIAALATGSSSVVLFVVSMAAGTWLAARLGE